MADFSVNYKHHYTPHLVDDSDEKREGVCWEFRIFSLFLLCFTWRCCGDVISARETTEAREKVLNQILRRHESSIGHQKCFLIEEIYKNKTTMNSSQYYLILLIHWMTNYCCTFNTKRGSVHNESFHTSASDFRFIRTLTQLKYC